MMPVHFSAEVATFLRRPIVSCLATINADGTPHLSYVWHEFTGDAFLISTEESRVKARNLARDGRAALSVLDPDNPYRWITVNGRVTITREGANDLILRLALHYQGEAGRAYGQQLQGPGRVVLILAPERLTVTGF
ncbi:MAG TPA: PPOX class F420-dependent oxidoreductase [Bacillota bacterium]